MYLPTRYHAHAGKTLTKFSTEATLGDLGPAAVRFLRTVADRVADRSGQHCLGHKISLFQELPICLLRGKLHILVRRSSVLLVAEALKASRTPFFSSCK
jgi:hypothetical protein